MHVHGVSCISWSSHAKYVQVSDRVSEPEDKYDTINCLSSSNDRQMIISTGASLISTGRGMKTIDEQPTDTVMRCWPTAQVLGFGCMVPST